MTIPSRELWLTPTHGLAAHHKFYPTKITVAHHQLRHFISTSEGELIYYVSGKDIFVLDLETQQNSLIATIPFESRCLAADLGWVCVGGEQNGDCAFIKVEKDEHGRPTCFGHDMTVDLLGGEIVNSMSIHALLNEGKGPDEPVVLIGNNDKTIKLYSLAQRQVLTVMSHPVPMNFAALSPDSKIIAAVGDSDQVYFYRRRLDEDVDAPDSGSARYAKYDWELFADPLVPIGDPVYDDYSFSVAFSPSGHLCAASSQGGSITIFDMQHLLESDGPAEKSIICSFRSSRSSLYGCVRSMTFAPSPWDILAWAEDHGKIGLADVRQLCVRRQILDLDRQKAEIVNLEDGTPVAYRNLGHKERLKQQHLARLRAMRGLSSRDFDRELSVDDLSNDSQRPNSRHDLLNYQSLDLDARERSVIEALETTMDNVETLTTRPYSINYTSSPRLVPGGVSGDDSGPFSGGSRSVSSRAPQPRRRTSVVLSEPRADVRRYLDVHEGQRTRLSASPGRIGDDDSNPHTVSTNHPYHVRGSSPRSQSSSIPPNDPWHVIEAALESARENDNSNQANLARIEDALEAERQLGGRLERQLAEERDLSLLLRRQLDTQQRLLAENSTQLEHLRAAARESNARVEASLERVLQRQLTSEQHQMHQRSHELQIELRVGTDYSRRLESERERLRGSDVGNGRTGSSAGVETAPPSAQTTALPTMSTRSSQSLDNISSFLTDYTASRHQRLVHIENLQRQVRRAESRVALAAIDIQALEDAFQRETGAQDGGRRRIEEGQTRQWAIRTPSATVNADVNDPTAGTAASESATRSRTPSLIAPTRRAAQMSRPMTLGDGRGESRRSELAGRVPAADMSLASMMFLRGMSGSRSLDANGNWRPTRMSALRVLGAAGAAAASGGRAEDTPAASDEDEDEGDDDLEFEDV